MTQVACIRWEELHVGGGFVKERPGDERVPGTAEAYASDPDVVLSKRKCEGLLEEGELVFNRAVYRLRGVSGGTVRRVTVLLTTVSGVLKHFKNTNVKSCAIQSNCILHSGSVRGSAKFV